MICFYLHIIADFVYKKNNKTNISSKTVQKQIDDLQDEMIYEKCIVYVHS